MSATPAATAIAEPPKCPHCKKTMSGVTAYNWVIGQWLVLTVACLDCGVLTHTQIVHVAAIPQPEPEPAGPRIVKPS